MTFSMQGTGQSAEAKLEASPTVLSFGGTTVGGQTLGGATFRNVGGAPLTIERSSHRPAPFGVSGAPESGKALAPGEAVTVQVTFEPTREGNFSGELTLETSAGPELDRAVRQRRHARRPEDHAGNTRIRQRPRRQHGDEVVHAHEHRRHERQPHQVQAADRRRVHRHHLAVRGHDARAGRKRDRDRRVQPVSARRRDRGLGDQRRRHDRTARSQVHGQRHRAAPGPGWSHNGSATITGGVVQTTAATSHQAGSAFFETPLESKHLVDRIRPDDQRRQRRRRADADVRRRHPKPRRRRSAKKAAGSASPASPGIAVAFDTYKNSANPSNNFVGITDGSAGAGLLHWLSTSTSIPALRTATRHVKIETLNGTIAVWVEGTKCLSATVALPPKVPRRLHRRHGRLQRPPQGGERHDQRRKRASEPPPKKNPPAASLKITDTVGAPGGSSQAETTADLQRHLPLELHNRGARQRRLGDARR